MRRETRTVVVIVTVGGLAAGLGGCGDGEDVITEVRATSLIPWNQWDSVSQQTRDSEVDRINDLARDACRRIDADVVRLTVVYPGSRGFLTGERGDPREETGDYRCEALFDAEQRRR